MEKIKLMYDSGYSSDGLWITVHKQKKYANKMDEYSSIALDFNDVCNSRTAKLNCRKDIVCRLCYARIQATIHPSIRTKMKINSSKLSDVNYKASKIHTINGCLRYISFGDINTSMEATNILKHILFNDHLKGAVWTKQYKKFIEAIKTSTVKEVPKNLILIWSASKLDSTNFIIPEKFTKSFYVYTTEEKLQNAKLQAESKGFAVTECTKQCSECNVCYHENSQSIVMELLKSTRKDKTDYKT